MNIYEKRRQRIESLFEDHEATHTSTDKIERLTWKKPDSSTYLATYLLDKTRGALSVYGNLNEAVYCWYSADIDLAWIADCSLDYFASKCRASPNGRRHKDFDPDVLIQAIKEDAWNLDDEQRSALESCHARSISDWQIFLAHHERLFSDVSDIYHAGLVIDEFCQAHLIGLKMAMQSLHSPTTKDNE